MALRQASACPRTGRPDTRGGDAHHGRSGAAQGIADPGHAEDDPDRHDRVARREQDDVSGADRVQHPWRGRGPIHPCDDETLSGDGGSHPHPPFLEVHRSWPLTLVDDDVGLDRGVSHRQQGHAAVGQPPPLG